MDDSSPPAGPSSSGAASSTTDSESRARSSSTIADKMFFSCILCSEFQHCEQNGQFIKEILERKIGETLSRLGSSLDPGW